MKIMMLLLASAGTLLGQGTFTFTVDARWQVAEFDLDIGKFYWTGFSDNFAGVALIGTPQLGWWFKYTDPSLNNGNWVGIGPDSGGAQYTTTSTIILPAGSSGNFVFSGIAADGTPIPQQHYSGFGSYSFVPEPSVTALLALGAGLLLFKRYEN